MDAGTGDEVQRHPLMEVTWTDPVTGHRGYLVIDSLVRGLASGGLRVREGCTFEEVRGLARAMALKEALVYDPDDRYIPLGGAKGGLDATPGAPETRHILERFMEALRPLMRERWCTGEDFGVRQELLDELATEIGLPSTIEPLFDKIDDPDGARQRLNAAFAQTVEGVPLADLVGGYGVAEAALAYAESAGIFERSSGTTELTAAVQGMGSIGGASARYLARAGVTIVGIADRDGLIYNADGLDVEALLAARDPYGLIDRASLQHTDQMLAREEWLELPVDLLVPAAVSYAIAPDDVPRIKARLVVEGANMPTRPDAEADLARRGIPVVPDFLANVATNAWWWWVVFGDIDASAESAFTKISKKIRQLIGTVSSTVARTGGTPRDAALSLAEANRERLAKLPEDS